MHTALVCLTTWTIADCVSEHTVTCRHLGIDLQAAPMGGQIPSEQVEQVQLRQLAGGAHQGHRQRLSCRFLLPPGRCCNRERMSQPHTHLCTLAEAVVDQLRSLRPEPYSICVV